MAAGWSSQVHRIIGFRNTKEIDMSGQITLTDVHIGHGAKYGIRPGARRGIRPHAPSARRIGPLAPAHRTRPAARGLRSRHAHALILSLAAVAAGTLPASANQPEVVVAGSGRQDFRDDFGIDFVWELHIQARQDANGNTSGRLVTIVHEYPGFGKLDKPWMAVSEIECLYVDGDRALLAGTITSSSFPESFGQLVGAASCIGIADLGGPGQDEAHAELARGIAEFCDMEPSCENIAEWDECVRSFLFYPIDSGNFHIRVED
jgi:hypothetical protein